MKRRDQLQRLGRKSKVKILIIEAGINGIGTFGDLALQGIDILMVDQGDFCSGTSVASSHMVHDGTRYLENGERAQQLRRNDVKPNQLVRDAEPDAG